MPARRDHKVVARGSIPAGIGGCQLDAALQHLQGSLAGVVVVGKRCSGSQGNQGLAQGVLVTAVHRVRAAATGSSVRSCQLLAGKSGERDLVHLASPFLVKAYAVGLATRRANSSIPSARSQLTASYLKDIIH